jgi:hypothetical protein
MSGIVPKDLEKTVTGQNNSTTQSQAPIDLLGAALGFGKLFF